VVAQEHIEKAKKLETMLWLERWCEGTFCTFPIFSMAIEMGTSSMYIYIYYILYIYIYIIIYIYIYI